jgi:hypothetical protein
MLTKSPFAKFVPTIDRHKSPTTPFSSKMLLAVRFLHCLRRIFSCGLVTERMKRLITKHAQGPHSIGKANSSVNTFEIIFEASPSQGRKTFSKEVYEVCAM